MRRKRTEDCGKLPGAGDFLYINGEPEKGRTGIICTRGDTFPLSQRGYQMSGTRKGWAFIASHLFAVLREFDEDGVERSYSESFKAPGLGEAIMNRLLKAAGHQKLMYLTENRRTKEMSKVTIMDHPLISTKLSSIRRKETGSKDFNQLISKSLC